ncbi:MAG TPA: sulfide/dihydroorotate dehydrogenase-like FAD/NAD-binding protein [Nitrospirae bacterium]|nr:sulfide/dihydroorotate dehydrogenase-like FAD/NAD-binding protein [Nitrospirota bacterium]
MPEILQKRILRRPDVFYYRVAAPLISRKAQPGQFVIIRLHEHGERIPLSLADICPEDGTISLVVMAVGKTTTEMSLLKEGDSIRDLCGPLGKPTPVRYYGRVVLVGGGFGIAPLYPIGRAMKEKGNDVITIQGARSSDLIIYRMEMMSVSDRLIITTDDGSEGLKGRVTDALRILLDEEGADLVMAVGPAVMMKAVSGLTRSYGVKTVVSLNPIMVDGTGMCGGCRVLVDGKTRFVCVDGPEFDGHRVDWDTLMLRQKTYREEERLSFEEWKKRHPHVMVEG